jgi:hypothetical protein
LLELEDFFLRIEPPDFELLWLTILKVLGDLEDLVLRLCLRPDDLVLRIDGDLDLETDDLRG